MLAYDRKPLNESLKSSPPKQSRQELLADHADEKCIEENQPQGLSSQFYRLGVGCNGWPKHGERMIGRFVPSQISGLWRDLVLVCLKTKF